MSEGTSGRDEGRPSMTGCRGSSSSQQIDTPGVLHVCKCKCGHGSPLTSLTGLFLGGGQGQQFSNSSKLTRKLMGTFLVHSPNWRIMRCYAWCSTQVLGARTQIPMVAQQAPQQVSHLPSPKTVIFNLICSSLDYYAQISKLASSGSE